MAIEETENNNCRPQNLYNILGLGLLKGSEFKC